MAIKAECAWGRVFICETKNLCSNLTKSPIEGSAKLYKDYPKFIVGQYEFNRVCKILDEKISNWRNKEDEEICERMQRSMNSRFAQGGKLVELEKVVVDFRQYMAKYGFGAKVDEHLRDSQADFFPTEMP